MITQNQEKMFKSLESFMDETFDYNDLPGIAAGVYCGLTGIFGNDGFEFIGTRGYSDYENRVPLQEDDIFHCASVSKLFTSTAIMKLVERGTLDLQDKLTDLLPSFEMDDERFRSVELWQMLSHTSGIGDCSDYHWDTPLYGEEALEGYVYSDEVCAQPMVWAPGTGFRYSNVAYEILGHIASEHSSLIPDVNQNTGMIYGEMLSPTKPYEDLIEEFCLQPADMGNSTMKTFERPGWRPDTTMWEEDLFLAVPYERLPDRSISRVTYYPYTRQHAPSSTLTSNIGDLLKWGRAHLEGTAIFKDQQIYETIWKPYAEVPNNGEKIGIGWFMRQQEVSERSFTLYGHEGSDDGFRSSFWICPELDVVTVVLSNLSNAPVKKINKKLFSTIAEELMI